MPDCQYCEEGGEIVPVLDKNIEEQDKPGNKYRRLCVECDRFNRMASGDEWDDHPDALVIPVGEPRKASAAIEASLFFDEDTIRRNSDDRFENEPDHEFDCPVCDTHLTGYPDECDDCNAEFEW